MIKICENFCNSKKTRIFVIRKKPIKITDMENLANIEKKRNYCYI